MSKKKSEKSYNKKHAKDRLQEKTISGQSINEFINEEWLKTKNLIELVTKRGR